MPCPELKSAWISGAVLRLSRLLSKIIDLLSASEVIRGLPLRGLSQLELVSLYRLIVSCTVDFGIFNFAAI